MTQRAIVLTNSFSAALNLKDYAHKRGMQVIGYQTLPLSFFDEIPAAYRPPYIYDTKYFDHMVIEEDLDAGVAKLKKLNVDICAVIPGSEMGVTSAGLLAHKLGLVCNDINLLEAQRNKVEMKRVVQNAGLRVPSHSLARSMDDVAAFIQKNGFPIVIKPTTGVGMFKFNICQTLQDAQNAFNAILGHGDSLGSICSRVDVEEYIEGTEYAVNIFADGKKNFVTDIWRYERTNLPSVKNIYYNDVMESLDDPRLQTLKDYALKICWALGIHSGPAHAEVMIDKKGPVMIEVGARFPGGRHCTMCRDLTNFDPFAATLDVMCGNNTAFDGHVVNNRYAIEAAFPTQADGKIVSLNGLEAIQKLESYYAQFNAFKLGEMIHPTIDLWTIPYYAWFVHADRDVLKRDAEIAHKEFGIVTN